MSFGFTRYAIEILKSNKALKTSSRKTKAKSGVYLNGKTPLKFKKANHQTKKRILYDKQLLERQVRFRIALVFLTVIFAALLIVLFFSFA